MLSCWNSYELKQGDEIAQLVDRFVTVVEEQT